jgi:hypothetical protein
MADLILTGTLADMGDKWDINVRLVNVRTGQAMAAIAMRTALFKPTELRDAGPMNEDFKEDTLDASWRLGFREKNLFDAYGGGWDVGTFCNFILDTTQGAEDAMHSLKIDYDFIKAQDWTGCGAFSRKKRDLTLYNGIEFYAKATKPITGMVTLLISHPDDLKMADSWIINYRIGTDWKKVRIPFSSFSTSLGWKKFRAFKYGLKPGDEILRLNRIESLSIGVESSNNPPGSKGSMWVDRVRFYK